MFITHAAIMFSNGDIVEGFSYQAAHTLARKLGLSGEYINGFLSSSGEFILPKEAAVVALQSGQIKTQVDELTPFDLWPARMSD